MKWDKKNRAQHFHNNAELTCFYLFLSRPIIYIIILSTIHMVKLRYSFLGQVH
jgi:hypothetical protein